MATKQGVFTTYRPFVLSLLRDGKTYREICNQIDDKAGAAIADYNALNAWVHRDKEAYEIRRKFYHAKEERQALEKTAEVVHDAVEVKKSSLPGFDGFKEKLDQLRDLFGDIETRPDDPRFDSHDIEQVSSIILQKAHKGIIQNDDPVMLAAYISVYKSGLTLRREFGEQADDDSQLELFLPPGENKGVFDGETERT